MHRRRTHEDEVRTKNARAIKEFGSRYSYYSTRIHPCTDHQCVYLAGQDCNAARLRALARACGRCEECGRWDIRLEVHHIEHKTKVSRCWCDENLKALCKFCHRGNHVQVKFGWERALKARQEQAIKDFEAIYPPEEKSA